jgi:hypothetical protein
MSLYPFVHWHVRVRATIRHASAPHLDDWLVAHYALPISAAAAHCARSAADTNQRVERATYKHGQRTSTLRTACCVDAERGPKAFDIGRVARALSVGLKRLRNHFETSADIPFVPSILRSAAHGQPPRSRNAANASKPLEARSGLWIRRFVYTRSAMDR